MIRKSPFIVCLVNGTWPVAFGAGCMEGQVAVDGEGLQVVVAFEGNEAKVVMEGVVP